MLRYLKDGRYGTFWFGKNGALAPESSPLSPTEWRDTSVKLGRSGFPGGEPPWLTDEPLTMRFDAKFDRRSSPDYDLVQMAIKVLERKKKDRSFCIFFLLVQPHPP